MTIIKKVTFTDLKHLKSKVNFLYSNTDINKNFIFQCIYNFLSGFLPLSFKFWKECYVAIENNYRQGMISLEPECSNKLRWKINNLLLNENSLETGKQLIDYAVSKLGAQGVETFLVKVEELNDEIIALFTKACGFRNLHGIDIWETSELKLSKNIKRELFKTIIYSDSKKIRDLHNESLFPQLRPSISKTLKDIQNEIKKNNSQKWIIENKSTIEAYIKLSKTNNNKFYADIIASLAYQDYYDEIIDFLSSELIKTNKNAKLIINVNKGIQSYSKLEDILKEKNYNISKSVKILIKDYWQPIKDNNEQFQKTMSIFPSQTSPACNIISINQNTPQ